MECSVLDSTAPALSLETVPVLASDATLEVRATGDVGKPPHLADVLGLDSIMTVPGTTQDRLAAETVLDMSEVARTPMPVSPSESLDLSMGLIMPSEEEVQQSWILDASTGIGAFDDVSAATRDVGVQPGAGSLLAGPADKFLDLREDVGDSLGSLPSSACVGTGIVHSLPDLPTAD